MIALRQETASNYSRMMNVRELNADVLNRAKLIFDDYKARGVLFNDSFEDDVWKISDEKSVTSITIFDEQQVVPLWVGCTAAKYRSCLNDLATTHPTIAAQWDYDKNKLTPQQVMPGSNKKIWCKCKRGHSWLTSVLARTNGSQCPRCNGKTHTRTKFIT